MSLATFLLSLPQQATIKLRVSSDSMRPFLKVGDVVWIRKNCIDQVRVGDVILFHQPRQKALQLPILHRVVQKQVGRKLRLRTKGDNARFADKYLVTETEYIGQMLGKEHWLLGKLSQLAAKILFWRK